MQSTKFLKTLKIRTQECCNEGTDNHELHQDHGWSHLEGVRKRNSQRRISNKNHWYVNLSSLKNRLFSEKIENDQFLSSNERNCWKTAMFSRQRCGYMFPSVL